MAVNNSQIQGNLYVAGSFSASTMVLPSGTVTDNAILAFAGIQASKCQQQHEPILVLCDSTTNPAVTRQAIHCVYGATATIVVLRTWAAVGAGAASSITLDLQKNGTTILTSPFAMNNLTASYAMLSPAGYTSTSLVAGDVLEIVLTAPAGINLPKGVCAQLIVREDAQ